jgi:hypothetical protein
MLNLTNSQTRILKELIQKEIANSPTIYDRYDLNEIKRKLKQNL